MRAMYKGTLRLLLVLLHDFPEFLCEHHHTLCDVIPASCVQMRNLILSAFPRNMRLPDPFTPNLKVDLLPEVAVPPTLSPEPERLLPEALRVPVDAYLRQRAPPTLPTDLAKRLLLLPAGALLRRGVGGCGLPLTVSPGLHQRALLRGSMQQWGALKGTSTLVYSHSSSMPVYPSSRGQRRRQRLQCARPQRAGAVRGRCSRLRVVAPARPRYGPVPAHGHGDGR